jgi:mono/diheme cytochrome c family protein
MTSLSPRTLFTCIAVFFCSIAILTVINHRPAYASSADARAHGAAIFHTSGCERCHSITGVGGDRAPDLGSVGQRRGSNKIKLQILKGGHGMPPFEAVLKKDEVQDLVAFLTSCRTDTPPGCRQWMPAQPPQ